jgi:hypothetical protein
MGVIPFIYDLRKEKMLFYKIENGLVVLCERLIIPGYVIKNSVGIIVLYLYIQSARSGVEYV